MSQQGLRQQSVRDVTGTEFSVEGDWHALWDDAEIPAGMFNERMLAWINLKLAPLVDYTNVNDAMNAFAADQGFVNWSSMGTFDATAPE
jgi:hypothetical protein